uniref:Uncharacterized protein n=1 Tax=Anguilla anguilla TaxID=7936 RepID=A0A0E9P6C4_ANGAN
MFITHCVYHPICNSSPYSEHITPPIPHTISDHFTQVQQRCHSW